MRRRRQLQNALGCQRFEVQEVRVAIEIRQIRQVLRQLAEKSFPRVVKVHDANQRLKKSTILSYSCTSNLLKQCGFAHPAKIPRGLPDVDSDPKAKSAAQTNDVLTN
jgi:hypothetical protein